MHQKKSEVQIGKESSDVSSDFNPIPFSTHQKPHSQQAWFLEFPPSQIQILTPRDAPYKRHVLSQTHSPNSTPKFPEAAKQTLSHPLFSAAAFRLLRLLSHLRRLRLRLRLILLLSLPFFYFLLSHPSHSVLLDFLSTLAFSAALLFSLNLALPRLPSIRLFLARKLTSPKGLSKPPLLVFWSIGSRRRSEKRADSGSWMQVYINGDVYEGEFHQGRCSGSGVYYYYMSGRYEGDWVDGKYDGYGVETWARGSRYRGQYRRGLRHGFGVYRFYTGDVYAGEWSNGPTGRVMGVEFIPARTGIVMLGSSSGGSSTDLAITISEMATRMPGSILLTGCMDFEYIRSLTGIDTREPGMRVEDKDLGCILSEMERLSPATGNTGFMMFQAHKIQHVLFPQLLFIIPKYSILCRKHVECWRKRMMWGRLTRG